ncbi:MAG: twin-arginine translocase TatA/TatE family subunit [Bacteroidales bacterium]|nr:twin-arginine translocase TatA/TatE family subunit [Bacteroidales bacterium]
MVLLMIGTTELIIIALLALLLFGGKKLPELMRGLGTGVKNFKDGMNGLTETDKPEEIKSEVIETKGEIEKEEKKISDGSK